MPRTPRKRGESEVYHVIIRGVGQQLIFEDDGDRTRFLGLLAAHLPESEGSLLAWCLMENHVHLLLRMELHALAKFMGRIETSYALYFNGKHGRSGHLFQDRFKSEPVDTDEYLLTVVRYIHQNPVKAGIAASCRYRWSSYGNYVGAPTGDVPVETEPALGLMGGFAGAARFHDIPEEGVGVLECRQIGRVSDEEAIAIAVGIYGDSGLGSIKALPKADRDAALRRLKDAGLRVRQIQRLTGVSASTISRA